MADLLEALKSVPASYAAVIAVIAALFKAGKGLFEFHDEHLQKRPFKRLAFLAKEVEGNAPLTELVSAARSEQVFRAVLGRTASPQFMAALQVLVGTGKFSLLELKVSQLYLQLVESRIVVSLGWGAWLVFWASLAIVLLMGAYVAAIITPLLLVKSLAAYLTAAVLLGFYFLFSWFIGRDARAVHVARRVRSKIESLQPNPSIERTS